jgi:hypothetical protein
MFTRNPALENKARDLGWEVSRIKRTRLIDIERFIEKNKGVATTTTTTTESKNGDTSAVIDLSTLFEDVRNEEKSSRSPTTAERGSVIRFCQEDVNNACSNINKEFHKLTKLHRKSKSKNVDLSIFGQEEVRFITSSLKMYFDDTQKIEDQIVNMYQELKQVIKKRTRVLTMLKQNSFEQQNDMFKRMEQRIHKLTIVGKLIHEFIETDIIV